MADMILPTCWVWGNEAAWATKEADMTLVEIDYTNWEGKRGKRLIVPIAGSVRFGSNNYHPEAQWLIAAVSKKDGLVKEYALKDIHSWTPVTEDALPQPRLLAPTPGA